MIIASNSEYLVQLPKQALSHLSPEEEHCIVINKQSGEQETIYFSDYEKIYAIPGLCEFLCNEKLNCKSHTQITSLIEEELIKLDIAKSQLKVLDLGAGNGLMAESLRAANIHNITGIDDQLEAHRAAQRDRPDIFHDYYTYDLTDLSKEYKQEFKNDGYNCMTCVATCGIGGVSPAAFAEAFNFVDYTGLIAFNIHDDLNSENDSSGWLPFVQKLIQEGHLTLSKQLRYQHRTTLTGDPVHNIAVIGIKEKDIPRSWEVFDQNAYQKRQGDSS